MVSILENFWESKEGAADGGEDRLVVVPGYVAVIYGATSKDGKLYDGKSNGVLAAEAIANAVRRLPRRIDAVSAVRSFTAAVHDQVLAKYMPDRLDGKGIGDRPCASMTVYSEDRQEIWRVGDWHVALQFGPTWFGQTGAGCAQIYPGNRNKTIVRANSSLRAAFNQALIARGVETVESLLQNDVGRSLISPLLNAQPVLGNNVGSDMGYPIIDGTPVPERMIEVIPLPRESLLRGGLSSIVIASDGFLSFDQSCKEGKNFFWRKHPLTLAKELVYQRKYYGEDPLLIGIHQSTHGLMPGQGWHDDMTWVKFIP